MIIFKRSGYYISQELLKNGFAVRAVVRSEMKLRKAFPNYNFESVVELDIE